MYSRKHFLTRLGTAGGAAFLGGFLMPGKSRAIANELKNHPGSAAAGRQSGDQGDGCEVR